MAQKQIGARTEGDVYQGLFFWREAASLLIPGSRVRRVDLEHDEATGIDDVAVFYEDPGVDAGGWMCNADFYQLKYHVDRRDAYSSEALIDPSFISAKSSLLQRFFSAYTKIKPKYQKFRLHLASNWRWKDDDKLAKMLREYDGQLPDRFLTSGLGSELGKIRETWRSHLALNEEDFHAFSKTLRFQLDHFGRRHFRNMVEDRLARAGLLVPDASHASNPYESLVQQFLMNGVTSFDDASLRKLCEREGLLLNEDLLPSHIRAIGLRSFLRFAERLEEETDEFVCVVSHFDGRFPRDQLSWFSVTKMVRDFLGDPDRRARLRGNEHAIVLDCHGSLALLAGYELSRNSGCSIFPIQKPYRELWKPTMANLMRTDEVWVKDIFERDIAEDDVAVALSVTHDIVEDVINFLNGHSAPRVRLLLSMKPINGVGGNSVAGADHASVMAADLIPVLRNLRPAPKARFHIFAGAPNALLFFVGQYREALGKFTIYEHDFGMERHGSYEPSIVFPVTDWEDHDDT